VLIASENPVASDWRDHRSYAYDMLDVYPSDADIWARLNTATVERAGFGLDLDHLNDALKRVNEQFSREGLPEPAIAWLSGLRKYIAEQQREYGNYFGTNGRLGAVLC
jgi:hypothetical protein